MIVSFIFPQKIFAQKITVFDAVTKTKIEGVTVVLNGKPIGKSDENGEFILNLTSDVFKLKFTHVSYETWEYPTGIPLKEPTQIFLKPAVMLQDDIVVTAARRKQKIEEVTQSVAIVKPDFLIKNQTNRVDEILEKLPGISLQKGQINIRGSSGFSYGAGSRVMVLLDDMPLLTADASDAKWNYYPTENLEQIEVIKGASSALYGSSAMEGIVHLRTKKADTVAHGMVSSFYGFYGMPERDSIAWWNKSPMKYGISAGYRKKFGNLGIVSSLNYFKDELYRKEEDMNLYRANVAWNYNSEKHYKWNFGGSLNANKYKGGTFLFCSDVGQPYIPFAGTSSKDNNFRCHADFFTNFYQNENLKHTYRTRYYLTDVKNNTNQNSTSSSFFHEYQLQDVLYNEGQNKATLTAGGVYVLNKVISDSIYKNHQANNTAVYTQFDQKFNRVNIGFGFRFEANKQDTLAWDYLPIFRTGINIQASKTTFLRFSAGQAFRYPSVAERFISTSSGSSLKLFPNPLLKPETGWSLELGARRIFVVKKLRSYVDVAAFRNEYKDMMEYVFGIYAPPGTPIQDVLKFAGFKAINIAQAKITGIEGSGGIEFKFGEVLCQLGGGYTYINPINSAYDAKKDTVKRNQYLKYRRKTLARITPDVSWKGISVGSSINYNSAYTNMDQFFINLIHGLSTDNYWQPYSRAWIIDARIGYTKNDWRIDFFMKNALNTEYMEAPGNTSAPRNFSVQVRREF